MQGKIEGLEKEISELKEGAVTKEKESEEMKQRFLSEINEISDSVENELQVSLTI